MLIAITQQFSKWIFGEDGTAAAEFALVFPMLFLMMVGVWDVGNGLLANQKAINAAGIVIDLIGREESIDDDELAQAFQAGSVAMSPFPTGGLTIDVVSVQFDEDDAPFLIWSENSAGGSGSDALVSLATGLGTEGDGALIVQVTYDYAPLFAGFAMSDITMRERFFSRGRNTAVVTRE